jgi:hypothetical protein
MRIYANSGCLVAVPAGSSATLPDSRQKFLAFTIDRCTTGEVPFFALAKTQKRTVAAQSLPPLGSWKGESTQLNLDDLV